MNRTQSTDTIRAVLRALTIVLLWALVIPTTALGHAVMVQSYPGPGQIVDASPGEVRITFNEEIQLLNSADAVVVDQNGQSALAGLPFVDPSNVRLLRLPVRDPLLDDTYTVSWRVMGPDTHIVPGVFVFGVGVDELGSAIASPGAGAPSETGPWAVSARTLQLLALGGLLGLLAFRWLVWRREVPPHAALSDAEGRAVLEWGRDQFWMVFGTLALVSMASEAYLLVIKSAIANGVGILENLRNPSGISAVLSDTRFGELVQLRGGLLFVVFGTATWQFLSEYGSGADHKPATAVGRRLPALLMATLLLAILVGVSYSGHAAVTAVPALHSVVHTTHIAALATWATGLVATVFALIAVPRLAPNGGVRTATALLGRFSQVALVSLMVAFITGAIRASAHLEGPEQLVDTHYGRLILLKLALLVPIGLVAVRNRRYANSLSRASNPGRVGLAVVRRGAIVEIAISLVIIVVAGVLAAEAPGRS